MTTPVESQAQETGAHHAGAAPVELSHPVPRPVAAVWEALISPAGTAVWLGEGAVLGGKGESYHCTDGTSGVVRSYHPLEQLRVSWHATPDAPPTLIELDLEPTPDGTTLRLTHDHLVDAAQHDELVRRWQQRLAALSDHLTPRAPIT